MQQREAREEGRGGNNGASGGKQSLETPLSISPAGSEQAGRPHTLQALCRVRMLSTSQGPPDRGAHSSPEGGTGPRMAVGSQRPRKGLAHCQVAAPLPKRPRSELEVMSVSLPPPQATLKKEPTRSSLPNCGTVGLNPSSTLELEETRSSHRSAG